MTSSIFIFLSIRILPPLLMTFYYPRPERMLRVDPGGTCSQEFFEALGSFPVSPRTALRRANALLTFLSPLF